MSDFNPSEEIQKYKDSGKFAEDLKKRDQDPKFKTDPVFVRHTLEEIVNEMKSLNDIANPTPKTPEDPPKSS